MKFDKIKIYWPYAIFGLFIIVVIVNIAYIIIAKESWRGIITPNSYKKGVEYNQILKNIDEQYKIGIRINNKIVKTSPNSLYIQTFATNKNDEILDNISIIYSFKYLPDSKYDIVKLSDNTRISGLNINLNQPGKWHVETILKYQDKIVQDLAIIEMAPQ